MMQKLSFQELDERIKNRKPEERLVFTEVELEPMDLTGWNFQGVDFILSSLQHATLDNASFRGCSVENSLFDGCSLHGVDFTDANLRTASFRYCDLGNARIEGANLYGAILEHANLEGVTSDERTEWYKLHCPETGAFLGYKKCMYGRLVQLLIPADAKRTSATLRSCRCSKAKVLTIKSFDYKENFDEAWSLVDENFVYRRGEWVEVKDFNEDRWQDSTTGIHFWLTREEAWNY